jgi:hypothetical protein
VRLAILRPRRVNTTRSISLPRTVAVKPSVQRPRAVVVVRVRVGVRVRVAAPLRVRSVVRLAGGSFAAGSGAASVTGAPEVPAVGPAGVVPVGLDVSVGVVAGGVLFGGAHIDASMTLSSSVTAAVRASRRPRTVADVVAVIDCIAMTVPWNAVVVPSVAELPTCQYTLHGVAAPMSSTELFEAVVSVVPIMKTNCASGSPSASSVS